MGFMAMRRGYFRGFRRERDLSVYSQAYLKQGGTPAQRAAKTSEFETLAEI
jgi:hypothetical protein